jgi:hypothetical protein
MTAMRRWTRAALAIAIAAYASGCASTYMPRPGPRISLVMENGSYAYVRDGRTYAGGMFGGDIVEAVRGDPKAEEFARAYKNGVTVGLVLAYLGAAAAFAGLAVAASDEVQHTGGGAPPPTGVIILGSGLLVELVGAVIGLNAVPHLYDAINTYNDDVEPASSAAAAPVAR